MQTQTQKMPFEYPTQEAYFEQFIMPNFAVEISARPMDECEIKLPPDYERGSLDLRKHYQIEIKDKISGIKTTVEKELRKEFMLYVLETPTSMRMNPLEWVLRQRSRFDNKTIVTYIRRPERDHSIVTRFLRPNEKPKHAAELRIFITLIWIGAGLCKNR